VSVLTKRNTCLYEFKVDKVLEVFSLLAAEASAGYNDGSTTGLRVLDVSLAPLKLGDSTRSPPASSRRWLIGSGSDSR
jgi:hypothetical protein